MTFREPPGSGPGLSQRPNPGHGAGAAFHPSQLLRWDQLRHWERTRKYQWALLGLITHSKGMTSISPDFLGTCGSWSPRSPLLLTRLPSRGLVPERKRAAWGTQARGPRGAQCDSPFIIWALSLLPCDDWRQLPLPVSMVFSPSSACPPLTAMEGRIPDDGPTRGM